ncbi:flagellin lysine-N-methylase [Dehalobacter restrictus]|nr:flagellin lysine-N-methylase [Dehalobacter restrictus]
MNINRDEVHSMTEAKRKVLSPSYLKTFNCIASACENSCCIGFNIRIDPETFSKYKVENDPVIRKLFEENIYIIRSSTAKQDYITINPTKDYRCPFLTEEKLCFLQCRKGEQYLSEICASFPCIGNIFNGVLEKSATLACPEAARLALLQTEAMDLIEVEEPDDTRNFVYNLLNTEDEIFQNKPAKHLSELREFTWSILKDRRYHLDDRVVFLGAFMEEVDRLEKVSAVDRIPDLILSYTALFTDASAMKDITTIPVSPVPRISLFLPPAIRVILPSIESDRYLRCFSKFLEGIRFYASTSYTQVGKCYEEAYQRYYSPFMREHDYILENYLLNYVFIKLFPYDLNGNSVYYSYLLLAVNYALLKMQLVGISAYQQELTVDTAIMVIQSYTKAVEHKYPILHNLIQALKQNHLDSLAHITVFVKD